MDSMISRENDHAITYDWVRHVEFSYMYMYVICHVGTYTFILRYIFSLRSF